MTDHDQRALAAWLRRLKWGLAALPAEDRDAILAETDAHVREQVARGAGLEAALADFGDPLVYARGFFDEMELAGALTRQSSGGMLKAIARRAHRDLAAALAVAVIIILGAGTSILVLTAAIKLFDPAHAGLWRGPHAFFLGTIDDPASATELLGFWIYPLTICAVALVWGLARLLLTRVITRLTRRP